MAKNMKKKKMKLDETSSLLTAGAAKHCSINDVSLFLTIIISNSS